MVDGKLKTLLVHRKGMILMIEIYNSIEIYNIKYVLRHNILNINMSIIFVLLKYILFVIYQYNSFIDLNYLYLKSM